MNHENPDAGHGRMLDIVGLVASVGLAVAGVFLIPRWFDASRAEIDAEIARLEALEAGAETVRANHDRTSEELRTAEARLEHAIDRVPLAVDESAFLSEVVDLANEHEIRVGDYETGQTRSHATHDELDVTVEGKCSHPALCRLLAGLAASPRAGRVTHLSVDLVDPRTGHLNFRLTWRLYARPGEVASSPTTRSL